MAILSALATEVLIPVAGVIGIAFAVVQWVLVSQVKLSPAAAAAGGSKNGYGDYLIEEEEGLNDHNVVVKCAEIQNAIAEGEGAGPLRSMRCRSVRLDLRISCNRAGGRVFFFLSLSLARARAREIFSKGERDLWDQMLRLLLAVPFFSKFIN